MNMAPVLDLLPVEGHSIMEKRSFGKDPHLVSALGCTVIDHLQKNDILAVAKHFPGIGRTVLDSHEELPDLDTDIETLKATDILPFTAAIDHQVAGIMMSHIRYRAFDQQWPASLSEIVIHDLLRKELGYDGLVLTDDLDMGAISKHYNTEAIVQQCLAATVDIHLICHEGPKIDAVFDLIKEKCDQNATLTDKMNASLHRILKVKKEAITGLNLGQR
jgi:beta-N-acetylhexosaminidase